MYELCMKYKNIQYCKTGVRNINKPDLMFNRRRHAMDDIVCFSGLSIFTENSKNVYPNITDFPSLVKQN